MSFRSCFLGRRPGDPFGSNQVHDQFPETGPVPAGNETSSSAANGFEGRRLVERRVSAINITRPRVFRRFGVYDVLRYRTKL